jgi:hypothetical protein
MKAYHFQVNNTFWKARKATSCTPSISNVKGSHTIIRPSNFVHQGISFNGGESNIAAPMILRPADPTTKNQSADEVNFHENHIVNLQKINILYQFFFGHS